MNVYDRIWTVNVSYVPFDGQSQAKIMCACVSFSNVVTTFFFLFIVLFLTELHHISPQKIVGTILT